LNRIKAFPDWQRIRAEEYFLLLKEYEDEFVKHEMSLCGKKFRKCQAAKKFCDTKGISPATLYRWRTEYKKYGIEGLLPKYDFRAHKFEPNGSLGSRARRRNKWKKYGPTTFVKLAIPANKPLADLGKLAKAISLNPSIPFGVKESCLRALKIILGLHARRHTLAPNPPLTESEKIKLEQYLVGKNKKSRIRAKAVLMMGEHRSLLDICMELATPAGKIYRWHQEFDESRLKFVEHKRSSPAAREQTKAQRTTRVIDIIHKQPSFYGINRTSWTMKDIALAYAKAYGEHMSSGIARLIVKETGITWRHARKVWTSPDPLYREKIGKVIETLQNLKVGEAFFFIDEAGPYRVKKYGGKALTPKEEQREIPEVQSPKGSVQLIAALEALSNQITWRFISSRSTSNIVTMLEQLCSEYTLCSTLFVTWDDISCHSSHELMEWVKRHNGLVSDTPLRVQ
jgi:transposase